MTGIVNHKIVKTINDDDPHFILKTRRYSNVKTAAVPIPDMELTKDIDKGEDAKIWIEKIKDKIVMLVVFNG